MSTAESEVDAATAAFITIGKPAPELRALWLQRETQARIWAHFAEVTPLEGRDAEWVARGPAGGEYRWRTVTSDDEPDAVRWTTADGADVPNVGILNFRPAPGERGTELHLDVRFDAPGGVVGQAMSKLFHIAPHEIVRKALYRFRALAMTGEIPTTDPQPAARKGGADR